MKTRRSPRFPLEITILKQGTPSKKVLSASFFTMKDAYNDIHIYELSLKKFLKQKKQLKGFETRIYTDDSGKEIVLKIVKEDPTVSIYHFNFKPLREEVGHIGIFGMIPRFLPLFEPGLEVVWVTDIDIPDYWIHPSILDTMKKESSLCSWLNSVCYEKPYKIYGRPYTIMAGTFVSFHTFPPQLFRTYLKQLQNGYYKKEIAELIRNNPTKSSSIVPYGIDELFMNYSIYDSLKQNNIKCMIRRGYGYTRKLLAKEHLLTKKEETLLQRYHITEDKRLFKNVIAIYKKYTPILIKSYPCIQSFIDKLDILDNSLIELFFINGKDL